MWNRPSSPHADIVCFGLLRIVFSLTVLKWVYYERFSHTYKECFVSPLQTMWDLTIQPLGDSTSSLAYCYDTICNRSNPLLADIIHFDPLHIVVSLTILKRIY